MATRAEHIHWRLALVSGPCALQNLIRRACCQWRSHEEPIACTHACKWPSYRHITSCQLRHRTSFRSLSKLPWPCLAPRRSWSAQSRSWSLKTATSFSNTSLLTTSSYSKMGRIPTAADFPKDVKVAVVPRKCLLFASASLSIAANQPVQTLHKRLNRCLKSDSTDMG